VGEGLPSPNGLALACYCSAHEGGEGRVAIPYGGHGLPIPHKQTGFALLRFTSGVVLRLGE